MAADVISRPQFQTDDPGMTCAKDETASCGTRLPVKRKKRLFQANFLVIAR